MPEYKKNNDKNKMQPYELPSTPGAIIHLPSRLGYGSRIRVRSAAYKVHVEQDNEGQDRVFQTVDPAAAEQELLVHALLDPRTYHNMTENGRPIVINRFWIENEMDEDDALYLGALLMNDMNEEIGTPEEDTSKEPEGNLSPVTESGTSSPESSSLDHPAASQSGKKSASRGKASSEATLVEAK